MQLNISTIKHLLDDSFLEDYGIKGDITSQATIEKDKEISFKIKAREGLILCGSTIAKYFFDNYSSVKYKLHKSDANYINSGDIIISGTGKALEILMLERIILNYLQHLSAISTLTSMYVEAVSHSNAKICDTRKTIPMLRKLQKYAVTCGGGYNHRLTLDSSILIKDNHIAVCGSISKAIEKAKKYNAHYSKIEIECDNLKQVEEAINVGVDIIMLDNMSIKEIKESLAIIDGKAIVEVSGNVSLESVKEIAETGVDIISVGKITHSAAAVDIGLDIE